MIDRPPSIAPHDVGTMGFTAIIDIRPHAPSSHTVPGAIAVSIDALVTDPSSVIESPSDTVLIVCDIGVRSSVATQQLRSLGYKGAVSLGGGIEEWIRTGHPTDDPGGLRSEEFSRYDRQLKLPGFGIEAQSRLRDARAAIVGVGGLGVPVLSYLAAAGVGHLTIVDSDNVELSNLHRQPIYATGDVGSPKTDTAQGFASSLNPDIEVEAVTERIDQENAAQLLAGHDVAITCTDSFETAHAINAAAVKLGIPMVFGSVYRTEGQFAVFDASTGPCYACVFPDTDGGAALDCSIVGVLGPVTGVIGSIQAVETVKLLAGLEETATHTLTLYDAMSQRMDTLRIRKNPQCSVCGS